MPTHFTGSRAEMRALNGLLRSDALPQFLRVMYANEPLRWDPALTGHERARFVNNVLTRIRFVDAQGACRHVGNTGHVRAGQPVLDRAEHGGDDTEGVALRIGRSPLEHGVPQLLFERIDRSLYLTQIVPGLLALTGDCIGVGKRRVQLSAGGGVNHDIEQRGQPVVEFVLPCSLVVR